MYHRVSCHFHELQVVTVDTTRLYEEVSGWWPWRPQLAPQTAPNALFKHKRVCVVWHFSQDKPCHLLYLLFSSYFATKKSPPQCVAPVIYTQNKNSAHIWHVGTVNFGPGSWCICNIAANQHRSREEFEAAALCALRSHLRCWVSECVGIGSVKSLKSHPQFDF